MRKAKQTLLDILLLAVLVWVLASPSASATWLPPGDAVPTPTGWGACASAYRYRAEFPYSYMIGFCQARYPDWTW